MGSATTMVLQWQVARHIAEVSHQVLQHPQVHSLIRNAAPQTSQIIAGRPWENPAHKEVEASVCFAWPATSPRHLQRVALRLHLARWLGASAIMRTSLRLPFDHGTLIQVDMPFCRDPYDLPIWS